MKADAIPIRSRIIDSYSRLYILECTTKGNPTDEELIMMKIEVEEEQ